MLLEIISIVIIFLIIKNIYELYDYNPKADLIEIHKDNKANILENTLKKDILVINNIIHKIPELNDLSFQSIHQNNPGYIMNHNNKYTAFESIINNKVNIFNNAKIVEDLNLKSKLKEIYQKISPEYSCNFKSHLSLFNGGFQVTPLKKNKHNWMGIGQIEGETIIYLINPKHKHSKYLNTGEIKKISMKITLNRGKILLIPSEWYYFYETNNKNISFTIEYDNYFTYLFNLLR